MRVDQIGLLLWKNYIVRKRQPGILALVFVWPVLVFMILYTIRDNVEPKYHPTCQFPARSMPLNGLLPFVQSFICSIGNPCDPLSEYEEVPSYGNATLGPLVVDLQPMLDNETILSAVKTLPNSIQLLKSMAQILTRPEIKALFDRGIRLGDLFNNHEEIKNLLELQMPYARQELIDELFESSIKLLYLIEAFGSSNIDGVTCSPENLKKYLILTNEQDYAEISKILCDIDSEMIPDMLESLSKHLDFSGLLEMVDRVMAKFRDYDFFEDLRGAVETILDLRTVKKHVPEYLRIRQWLPKVIMMFKNVTFKEIDLTFVNKSLEILDPVFSTEADWKSARQAFLRLQKLLELAKGMTENRIAEPTDDIFAIMERLKGAARLMSFNIMNDKNVTQLLDLSIALLHDGAKLTDKILDRHAGDIEISTEILDGLRDFLSDNILATLSYILSFMQTVVRMVHHAAIIHEDVQYRIYNISLNHKDTVQKLLTNVDPNVYRTFVRSFSNLNFVEKFLTKMRRTSPEDTFCQEETLNEIFEDFKNAKDQSSYINELLCSDSGKKFISDVYDSLELKEFQNIVTDTLLAVINMAFKQVISIEKSNLTSVVSSVKGLASFLSSPMPPAPDWSVFEFNDEWKNVFEDTEAQGRLNVLGIHLSIAKLIGSHSLSYPTIQPDLENMDMLAEIILQDLHENPTSWIGEVRRRKSQLIESFYLTVTDKDKALKILEYDNFTRTYCTAPSPPALLNFPKGSNETALKALVCRLSKSVQTDLELNMTEIELREEARYRKRGSFNWTDFNAKTVEIYRYIDTLLHQKDTDYDLANLEKLKQDFRTSWTIDLSVKDVLELSVGLICKFFSVMESPLLRAKGGWKEMHAIGWASSVIFNNVERIVDHIQRNDRVAKLSTILEDMPQTEILLSAVLRNLSPLILDVVDIVTMKPIHLISILDDYKSREEQWPCIQSESVGSAMELRNGTREIVREMERISCNPALFIREWKEQPVLTRARKIFQHDDTVQLPPFNWTLGYTKFRRLAKKLDDLINDAKQVTLDENPNFWEHLESLMPEVKSIFDERWPDVRNDVGSILDYIDMELDKTVTAFKSNISASDVWRPSIAIEDRVLVLAKFISHVVHKTTRVMSDVLRDTLSVPSRTSVKLDLLPLLGFDKKSPIAIYYNQLSYVLATLLNGLGDPEVDNRIVRSLETDSIVTCSQLFEWWSGSVIGLTADEYRILKNFTCDLDPENFNAYTDLFMAESTVWRKHPGQYRSYAVTAIGDVYNFASEVSRVVKDMGNKSVTVEMPFSITYLLSTLRQLRDSLENYDTGTYKELTGNHQWTNYRLFIEGISEALIHIANAIKNVHVESNSIDIWDFVESGDVRQLLKILDNHPEETIALVASLNTGYSRTGDFLSYGDVRKFMCDFRFNSSYWSNSNRTRFLKEICSFDPYQLLKTITSEDYYLFMIGRRNTLTRLTPLSTSFVKLLNATLDLQAKQPNLTVRSNIFDSSTWRNLSNDTLHVIRNFAQIRLHVRLMNMKNEEYSELNASTGKTDPLVKLVRIYQLLDATIELMAGGDVWQKLRNVYENSRVKPILTLIEDAPNLVVSGVDTFVSSERLNDFAEKLSFGRVHPCDIDKYLLVPSFVRKKVLLSSVTNFCQKIVLDDRPLTLIDILPLDGRYEDGRVSRNRSRSVNETYFLEKIDHILSTIVRGASDGFREPKVPTWWTSFKEGTFKDFLSRYKKEEPRALAHLLVRKVSTSVRNILNSAGSTEDCSWCERIAFPLDILNTQLANHQLYAKVLCQLNRLNVSEIHEILMNDLNWYKTGSMMERYKYPRAKRTRDDFVNTFESTMHYAVDIMVNFQNETYRDRIDECFHRFVGRPAYTRAGLYVSLMLGALDSLQKNVFVLDTARDHKNIDALTKMAERYVPIWKPVRDVVKSTDVNDIEAFLSGAMINVNAIMNDRNDSLCRTKVDCRNATILYDYLSSKKAGKVFRYDPRASGYRSIVEISDRLSRSLDLDRIDRQLKEWRTNAAWDLTWLKEILRHLSVVIGESGNLLDVASKIDFQDVSNALGVPDIVDGVVNILKDKTVDKLFDGMKEIAEDVKPFIQDRNVLDDIYNIIVALESMDIFKNLGLLDMKYVIRDMFDNWDVVRSYLVDKLGISNDVALMLSQARIDMISVFMKERRALGLKDIICSPTKLSDMLNFNGGRINADEVSSAICQLDDSQTKNVTITLIKNLNFGYIFNTLKSANVKSILANANLTEAEGKMVLDNLGVAANLLPFFRDKLSSKTPLAEAFETDPKEETDEMISTTRFLQDSSEMLCGQSMVSDNGDLYKLISKLEDNSKEFDKEELDSLPTDFCRDAYKSVVAMGGGKIIWSYVKPLLRGRILYAPNTTVVNKVMTLANQTFMEMEHFKILMDSLEKTLTSLANLSEMSDSLRELQSIMSSDVMKIAVRSMAGGNFESGDFTDMNLSEISWRLKRSKRLIKMVGMLNDLLECVLMDRTRGFRTEEEMEAEARILMETRQFLAGVVFLDKGSQRTQRSLKERLPEHVVYKIRMDVDYVQSTKRLKNQFWIPGPESSFIEHLRYLRGFVQLQDSIDRAIIRTKSQKDQKWRTMTQQMPYPCWKDIPFQTTLYESQGIQVCFFFALMMCVGAAVRHIVWERESQNAMVMSVMGLKPWRNTMAWFITTFTELLIVMFSISLVVLAGKILPKSDPSLILIMMIDYAFSIVTFCYMISTICSSASLAAITTVVMFLLTFMPYVVVIAMEAVIGLGYKLLICLSMSTSFCYGCLYAARKEVQGVGLTWGSMWQESSPGDPMSLGLVLLMIAFDGCLYAVIGYLLARYTNSGRGFHDLRSRSLWWADTRSLYGRPSYLAFVNNLYFTNDVLRPSATYQDEESDASSLTVSEKQTGVRFEGVRKVYNTDQGDVVAVDDFTLKLCEGEVTSLLGRNGAGKTTIIKMLTGMLAPTNGEICLNGEEGFKPDIGVCPQDNVLIGTLTPREHLIFYAKLKQPKENVNMQRSVNEMLTSLELGRQEHEPVYRLSGGTKRRLCVALAFLGSPKLVILDEPGAGVDPAARRRIWRLIDQHRIGRTVILSTHHLDEADMLSDTVVVMHKGKILCTGSPLSLKMMHGRGYRLLVSFPGDRDANTDSAVERKKLETLKSVIEDVVPNAVTNEVSGTEVVVTLPFQGKNGINNNIAQAAKVLEDSRNVLGYSHFSLECDTLERVFLDLCSRAENGSSAIIRASQDSVVSVDPVGLSIPKDDVDLIDIEPSLNPSPVRQVKALLKKRLWHFRKDWLTFIAGLLLPTMFVAVAMGFSLIRPPSEDEPSLILTPNLYNTHPTYFYSIDNSNDPFLQHVSVQLHDRFGDDYAGAWQTLPNDTGTCQCLDGQQVCHGVSQAVEGLLQVLPGRPTLNWIVSTHQEYIEKRYGGWSLSHANDEPLFVVWFNNKGHHALPSYLSALNEAILRASGVQGRLTTFNHPLKLSSDQLNRTTLLQHVADVGVALVLLLAFNLVAAQGSKELVRERLSEEKRILFLAGVHPLTYWTTVLIWDFFVFGCSVALAVIVFEIFGLSAYVARDNLAGICLLLFLFAWAALPFSHLAEKVFDDSSMSNMVLFCVNTFIGVASLATVLVIDILGKTKTAEYTRNVLHNILLIFPQYALGDALVQISRNDITAQLLEKFHMDTYRSPLGWELLGPHYVFLAVVGTLFFVLNLMIECRVLPSYPWNKQRCPYEIVQEDDDVSKERMRVEGGMSDDILQTVKLRKEYRSVYGTNVAVQNLSIGVQAGKCFGLLGTNGAGKSTTFRMLTTEIIPTAGRIILRGKGIGSGPLCNGEVGYCPQSDALDGFLSPHQCLTIHAEVCGLNNVPKAVESALKRLDLLKYAHKRVSSLSGGNKRKLCTALSVMAPVPVVLMDEPTSGMDPATKDLVAKTIRRMTKNQSCVILTSHSVAECENLCTRVGILAKAGLRCIGTPQHLKHKFGEGYVAFLRFRKPVSSADLRKAITKYFPQATVSSRQANAARLLLPRIQDMAISTSFDKLKLLAEELKATDYTLTQSSLDQVLVNFSAEMDNEIDGSYTTQSSSNNVSNIYSSMDTIHMETF